MECRRGLAVALLCLAAATAAHATPAPPDRAEADARATAAVLAAIRPRLPPALIETLDAGVRIEWRDDLRAGVDGHFRAGTIALRRGLLPEAISPAADAASAPLGRAVLAAFVHELAHAWDRSTAGGASRDPRLLDLAGWSATPLHARLRRNPFRDRTPDAYELSSPAEFVAVNLEHFVLDPGYGCRRPALAAYLRQRTRAIARGPACDPPAFARPSTQGSADPSPLLALDPSRVYAVDYLLAEPDAHPMSRWGHAMLRLVVCAPGRAPGPDCRLDIAWHEVLSFRAFVDDVQVSSWRGLTGGYPARLFVLPLPQVIEDYTKVELRALRSVPLRLSPAEIASLLDRAAQVHWSYDGRYRFVDNNCAVETWRLLHDGVPRLAQAPLSSLTPTGLLARLERAGVADGSVLGDPDRARRDGYRFDSMADHLQAMLDAARATLPIPQARVRDWLARPAAERAGWFERADLRATAALLVLENAALRREEVRAMDAIKHRVGSGHRATSDDTALHDALELAARLSRPAALLAGGGYGLPDADERARVGPRLAEAAADWDARTTALRRLGEQALPRARRESLAAVRANVELLGARLRAQARDAT
ncbi:DUF4105 domain-containing protein [Cognatilysobacter segetis]|uniref:DUF7844 domain-containing protein n=1 Tax=Cognatilysobacter segetis TaxID=2492394 RepID=UPI00105C7525|nr:DUF4105 domain-containing protein [Lysobacter segetis]